MSREIVPRLVVPGPDLWNLDGWRFETVLLDAEVETTDDGTKTIIGFREIEEVSLCPPGDS